MDNGVRFLFFLCFLVALVCPSTGQTLEPTDRLRITLDIARFRGGDDEHVNAEVYYGFARRALTFRPDSGAWKAGVDVTIFVKLNDSLVQADRWLVPHSLRDTSLLSQDVSLVGNYPLQLRGGDYLLRVIARDMVRPERADSVALQLPIRPFPTSKPVLSDIEFSGTIRQGKEGGQFYKNTLEVIPNIGGLYTEAQQSYFYAEAYNLSTEAIRPDYLMRVTVLDAVGHEVLTRERPKKTVGESSVIVDHFGVDKLKSGTYTLVLQWLDTTGTILSNSGRKFFVYNASLGVDSSLLTSMSSLPMSVYSSMTEAELDQEFSWAQYEARDQEKRQYKELKGEEPKRKFLSELWRKRPPGTREEYMGRVEYCNSNFGHMKRPGYKTERGRVHIVYGPPDDIERHPNETDTKPYEIWNYNNIQGGVIFVFLLKNTGGEYELVHSTHRNELHDPDWMRFGNAR